VFNVCLRSRACSRVLWALLLLGSVPAAHAQFTVIDPAAVTQLLIQVQEVEREVAMAQAQVNAMTGGRGMNLLLSGTTRNYLPVDWPTLVSAMQGGGGSYGVLYSNLQAAQRGDAVLSPPQLASLSPASSQQLLAQRQSIALMQAITRVALANSSNRFSALQQLITAIAAAGDQKASLDLNARIAAEQGMLQNEHTKLQVLYQMALAERWADEQRLREQVIAAHGGFATRFQPAP
jgi:type IV secretion system protein VirB5